MAWVLRWGACLVKNAGSPHAGARQCGDAWDLFGLVYLQDKLSRDCMIQTVGQQANTALPVVRMNVDIRLVNQQRRLSKDQQRCKYPVVQTPVHAVLSGLLVTDDGRLVVLSRWRCRLGVFGRPGVIHPWRGHVLRRRLVLDGCHLGFLCG